MIAMNDRIGQAWYTVKNNANVLDTFRAMEQGYVGGFLSFKPFFYYPASQPTFKRTFDVSYVEKLPQVDIIYCHQSYDGMLIQHAIKDGAKGLVLAGTGAGGTFFPCSSLQVLDYTDAEVRIIADIASIAEPYVEEAHKKGIPVVVSIKINVGAVVPSGPGSDTISA